MSSYEELVGAVTKELGECLLAVKPESVARATDEITGCKRIFLVGAGRSGAVIRTHATRLVHLGRTAHVVGEATTPSIGEGDLLLVGSGSGRTASLVTTARQAKQAGARVLLITTDVDSPLAQLADCVVPVHAPTPKASPDTRLPHSVQPMGALFEQALLVLLDIFVLILMERDGVTSDEMFSRHANLE